VIRRPAVACAALVALVAACGPAAERGPAEPRLARSGILITIDTLRDDHLSSYGYARRTSPHLDAFFAQGTRFAHAFSTSSRTAPSHVSMLTGLHPLSNTVGVENGQFPLSPDVETLAEACRRAGLRTAAIVSNPVLQRGLGLDQGFESYDDELRDRERNRPHREQDAERAVDKALAKLAELRGERFFLWLHLQDPHGPYTPPPGWAAKFIAQPPPQAPGAELPVGSDPSGHRAIPSYQVVGDERRVEQYVDRYDAEIAYLDSQLARLFDELARGALLEDTLVAITSDHGEAFGEDGFYFAHGHSLGLDQSRVPLAFVGAGTRAGSVRPTPVSNLALHGTFLDALGVRGAGPPGASLWPALATGAELPPARGFGASATQWAAFVGRRYLRRDRYPPDAEFWRLGNPLTGAPYVPLGEQLVALGAEAGAGDDEAAVRTALAEFVTRSEQEWQRVLVQRAPGAALTPAQVEQLRALGYLR
jgi:arylsulfatase